MKVYDKLVRDRIPAIIAKSGKKPVTRMLDNTELFDSLLLKLQEEFEEFTEARNIEELADIQEVILALADLIADRAELEKVRAKKAAERGEFKKKIFLERVE